jgi:transposase
MVLFNAEENMEDVAMVGIDLGKRVFYIHCQDSAGKPVLRKKMSRAQLFEFFAALPPCLVAMEAGAGSHCLSRQLRSLGHTPKLIAPHFVRPFVKSNKNDSIDAEAICEAASRPSMRFVTPKSENQQILSALQRLRESLIAERVRTINQLHAFLLEVGVETSRGPQTVKRLPSLIETHRFSSGFTLIFERLAAEFKSISTEIGIIEKELTRRLDDDEAGRRLLSIPGIGPITACALLCALGDGEQFTCGRDFAASVGLIPRQRSTGGVINLLGVSKRGDKSVRTLLVLCARFYMVRIAKETGPLANWVRAIAARRHPNVAACALANKYARIAWAVVAREAPFDANRSAKRQ